MLWGAQTQGTSPAHPTLCRPEVTPGAKFFLLNPIPSPEEEAATGALTSGQIDAKGSSPGKVAQRG